MLGLYPWGGRSARGFLGYLASSSGARLSVLTVGSSLIAGGFSRQGDADEGAGKWGDVAGVGAVAVEGHAARAGAEGEGAARAGGYLADHGEAAAAADLAGPRDPHLEGVAQGVVVGGGELRVLRVLRQRFAHPHPAVGDGDDDLFSAAPAAAHDVLVGLHGRVGAERRMPVFDGVRADLRQRGADG